MPDNLLSVLVVDDDAFIAKSIILCLKGSRWTVRMAQTANAALDMVKHAPPHVLLCDAAMPGMSGVQLITAIKSDPTMAQVRVVLMTGLSPGSVSGAPWDGFLEKPFGPKELHEALEGALNNDGRRGRPAGSR